MATAKNKQKGSRRALALRVLLALALVLAGMAWYFGPMLSERAVAGTSYGARVACSCRYIGGRSLEDCRKDFESGMEMISLSEDAQSKSVTASVPILGGQTAAYREGFGCVLEPWDG